jgi:hypothetical protein
MRQFDAANKAIPAKCMSNAAVIISKPHERTGLAKGQKTGSPALTHPLLFDNS